MNRNAFFRGFLPIIVVTGVLGLMLYMFIHNLMPRFNEVEKNCAAENPSSIVLSANADTAKLSEIICNCGYAENKKDAGFISKIITERLADGRLPHLYVLRGRKYGRVPAVVADSCGVLSSTIAASYDRLGINDSIFTFCADSAPLGDGKIVVNVKHIDTATMKAGGPFAAVPVCLVSYHRDSAGNAVSDSLGYKSTDSDGKVVFANLDRSYSYSVLPVLKNFEFGAAKGVVANADDNKWTDSEETFDFVGRELEIPLFGNATLAKMKSDGFIMVRSPEEYKSEVVVWYVIVLLSWWVLALVAWSRKKHLDGLLLASCMFLTGLCVLMMYSVSDPLNDELKGSVMGTGVIIGVAIACVLQFVDVVKFYQDQSSCGFDMPLRFFCWLFRPFRVKVAKWAEVMKGNYGFFKKLKALLLVILSLPTLLFDLLFITKLSSKVETMKQKLPKGIGWLALALFITLLLWTPLGREVGGMKVNISIFGQLFQPSEVAKYLVLLFIAAFFTQYADTIIAYSMPNRIKMLGSKIKTLAWVISGLVVMMLLYIALGDMGPGLVIAVTFILVYSLVKSKVNLDVKTDDQRWKRILSCDFAMLVYGVVSFALFVLVGYCISSTVALIMGILWFVMWLLLGFFLLKKQLFESPLLMNLIIFIFIFGGSILGEITAFKDSDIVERFDQRTKMCVNTWGDIDIENHGDHAEPVSNIQVANGLWAMASGGFFGQGLGQGKPTLIPAFHTDMILASVGEQLGWIGLLLVVVAMYILLRRMLLSGYRLGHPFAFYICMCIAVVTGVQFFIIALGSSGMIPLTGITVPFLSYGRVSMIMNMVAFGLVLSISSRMDSDKYSLSSKWRNETGVVKYAYPIAIVSLVFIFMAVFTLSVWQYYQLFARNSTLIHRAFVLNSNGYPIIEQNPRIALIANKMYAGRICDRNGIVLATSDKDEIDVSKYNEIFGIDENKIVKMKQRNLKRYYPLGEHLFFMLGDINEGVLFSDKGNVGYIAEAQHLSYLRGYDNVLYDDAKNPVKVRLKTKKYKDCQFLATISDTTDEIVVRDYTFMLDYLKNADYVKVHNERVKDSLHDLHLTIDAKLQTFLQDSIARYVSRNNILKNNNLLRISAVVLDASNGDLLASANYPLPDYVRMRKEADLQAETHRYYYSDNGKYDDKKWHSYTDMDLGTNYQTYPGSTAKIMSAMAGFRKYGTSVSNNKYLIREDNRIEKLATGGSERCGLLDMETAIVTSSNCYFINLVNDCDLYSELDSIYKYAGVSIGSICPYIFSYGIDSLTNMRFDRKVSDNRKKAIAKYKNFVERNRKGSMAAAEWMWAWGQGYKHNELKASPLNMARVASVVANGGYMPLTNYVMGKNEYEENLRKGSGVPIMKRNEAEILKSFMKKEAAKHSLPDYIGGKTGTPERDCGNVKKNDGWYMFFVERDEGKRPLAVAIRIERLNPGEISSVAVALVKSAVIAPLKDCGYIK